MDSTWCEELTLGKDPDAGKDWGQEEKGATEDEMVGWLHCLDGQEFEQTPGDSEGQGGLAHCNPCGRKQSDRTSWLNNNNNSACLEPQGSNDRKTVRKIFIS